LTRVCQSVKLRGTLSQQQEALVTMTTEQTLAATEVATEATANENTQATNGKVYTEEEFNNHIAGLKASLTKKLLKPYEDLGDPTELRKLREEANKKAQDESLKRGEFERVLQDLATKKDDEIRKRDSIIEQFRVENPLLQAASEFRSVNPEQVKKLLRGAVRLNGEGEVEVTDDKGAVRYNDQGQPLQVRDLVKEFLDTNPHFVQPTPATTNSSHSIKAGSNKIDISKLDLRKPEHRKLYAQATGRA
jgi:hypothetical protein